MLFSFISHLSLSFSISHSLSSLSPSSLSSLHFSLIPLQKHLTLSLSLPLSNSLPSHLISSQPPPLTLFPPSLSQSLYPSSFLDRSLVFFGEPNGPHFQIGMELKSMWIVRYLHWVSDCSDLVGGGFLGSALCVCVCFFFSFFSLGGSCSGCWLWFLAVSFCFVFFFSLGGFCGGCFLWWLLLVVGLMVFLVGFGGWHGGGVVVAIVVVVVVTS